MSKTDRETHVDMSMTYLCEYSVCFLGFEHFTLEDLCYFKAFSLRIW